MVIVLLAIMVVAMFVKECPHEHPEQLSVADKLAETFRSITRAFSTRTALLTALVCVDEPRARHVQPGLRRAVHAAPRLEQEEYAAVDRRLRLPAGFVASLGAGFIADLRRRRLAAVACFATAAGWLVFAMNPQWWHYHRFIYALSIVEPLSNAVLTVSLWALCMDTSDPKVGATQFAAYRR